MTPADVDQLNSQRLVARLLPATVHDARNALQGISGTAELVATVAAGGAGQVDERVRAIMRQTHWIGERLELLLKLSLPAAVSAERLDVGRLCSRVIDFRRASWGRQAISAVIPEQGLSLSADVTATMRVLLNLIVNAETSLLRRGGGVITITANAAGPEIVLEVEDQGGGVSEAAEPLLFTTASPSGHLATGLAASRRLCEAMGGTLTWLGRERPATFVVRLPSGR